MPGFQIGLVNILGPTDAANVTALWEPLCVAVDLLVATDNWFNQNDQIDDDGAGEDEVPGA
jgi:hypothetical protein